MKYQNNIISHYISVLFVARTLTFTPKTSSTASNEVERQSWVTALELSKAKAIRAIESEEEEEDNTANAIPSEELNAVVRDLTLK